MHLHEVPRAVKFIEIVEWWLQGPGVEFAFNGTRFQFEKMSKFWRCPVLTAAQRCARASCHRTVHLKMAKTLNFPHWRFYGNLKTIEASLRWRKVIGRVGGPA